MILLIGPPNWEAQMLHKLGDRTTHSGTSSSNTRIMTTARFRTHHGLAGIDEWIEIVGCTQGYEWTWIQDDIARFAEEINKRWLERFAQTYVDKLNKKR